MNVFIPNTFRLQGRLFPSCGPEVRRGAGGRFPQRWKVYIDVCWQRAFVILLLWHLLSLILCSWPACCVNRTGLFCLFWSHSVLGRRLFCWTNDSTFHAFPGVPGALTLLFTGTPLSLPPFHILLLLRGVGEGPLPAPPPTEPFPCPGSPRSCVPKMPQAQ